MKDTSEKQIRRPGGRLRIFFVVVVLVIAALMLWHKYSYRGMAELPLRTEEARAASQELCARHETLRSVELRYRFPGFLKVQCRAGSLTEADARQIAQEVAALLKDEGFMASYASAYRQRYPKFEMAPGDAVSCVVQFFRSSRTMPEYEAFISPVDGDYVVSLSLMGNIEAGLSIVMSINVWEAPLLPL